LIPQHFDEATPQVPRTKQTGVMEKRVARGLKMNFETKESTDDLVHLALASDRARLEIGLRGFKRFPRFSLLRTMTIGT